MFLHKIFLLYSILSLYSVDPTEGAKSNPTNPYEVYYKWRQMDFNYKGAPATRAQMIKRKKYIPQNVIMASVKISGDRMFLNCPRFLPGVPSTVNWAPYSKNASTGCGPLLNPYPSWKMQEIGNCKAIQSVQTTEIDQWNRLWIVDNGRVNVLGPQPINKCPPKLLIIDLNTDKVIYKYIFPADVISRTKSLLKDVTLACTSPEDCVLYIIDLTDPRIIIYDHYRRRSWYVTHPSMGSDPAATNVSIQGTGITASVAGFGICGMGLAPLSQKHDTLYYSSLAGFNIYNVSTQVLLSAPCSSILDDKDVSTFFTKPSQSDAMTMDAKGRLFYGLLADNSLASLNTKGRVRERILAQSDVDLQWPDTFGFDNLNGYMLLVTNKFQDFGAYNLSDYNIRVLRFDTQAQSYMY